MARTYVFGVMLRSGGSVPKHTKRKWRMGRKYKIMQQKKRERKLKAFRAYLKDPVEYTYRQTHTTSRGPR